MHLRARACSGVLAVASTQMRTRDGGLLNSSEAAKPLALLQYSSKEDYAPIPLKVMPFRRVKAESLRAHFRSLGTEERRVFVQQMPRDERQSLWASFGAEEQLRHLPTFALEDAHAWMPPLYSMR